MEELPSPPEEKKLPAPEEKLLRPPTFWERDGRLLRALSPLFLILILIAVFLYINKTPKTIQNSQLPAPTQSLPTSLQTPAIDPTLNWKTYTNSKEFYSFKYPSDWGVSIEKQGIILSPSTTPCPSNVNSFSCETSEPIYIEIIDNTAVNISLNDFLNKKFNRNQFKPTYAPIIISGNKGLRTSDIPGPFENEYVFVKNKNNIYQILWIKNLGTKRITQEEFDQILSTFKFLDQTTSQIIPLSTVWQMGTTTYTNPKLGISFEYPKVFIVNVEDVSSSPYKESKITFYMRISSPTISLENDDPRLWEEYENRIHIDIYQEDNSSNQTLEDFLAGLYIGGGPAGRTNDILKKGLVASSVPVPGSYIFKGVLSETPSKDYYFMNKGKIYTMKVFDGRNAGGDSITKDSEKVFDKIVSSIKFTQ